MAPRRGTPLLSPQGLHNKRCHVREPALTRCRTRPFWLLCLLACLALLLMPNVEAATNEVTGPQAGSSAPGTVPRGVLLTVTGAIGPATTEYLVREMEKAAAEGMDFVVIRIDTPGGLVSSMRDINRAILASPVPILMYVAPSGAQAASAGTYMMYASHLTAMAPGTNLGAATPVQMGGSPGPSPTDSEDKDGEDNEGQRRERSSDAMTNKAINDSVAYIRSLAAIHGRNADWAERAVRDAESLPAQSALEQNVVEILAQDINDLLEQAHGRVVKLAGNEVTLNTRGAELTAVEPDWRARFLSTITNPNLAYILLLLGIYGIIFELMNPGAIFPGTLGVTSLLIALLALNMLPINFAGVGLLLLGIGLMVAEAFVTSFGMLGIGGVIAFALGSVLLFDGSIPGFEISRPLIVATALISLVLLAVVLAAVVRAHRRQVVSGNATLIGQTARVQSWSNGQGVVHIHGEQWQARGDGLFEPGDAVQVLQREGLTLYVGPVTSSADGSAHQPG